MSKQHLEPEQKALEINLDATVYGSFAEIGAGQEVARYFFKAGAAAGTIAKTISAYDKVVSDHVYGAEATGRYVCESRLYKMLDHEYELMIDRLSSERVNTRFFAFADTVSTINFHRTTQGQGWLGLRFQLLADGEPNELILHVELLDNNTALQQEAIGILGVNMVYACFRYGHDYQLLLQSLMDKIRDRVRIDMVRITGAQFEHLDNRLLALELVQQGMTEVAMFDKKGRPIHPSEFLYKQNLLVVRGSFRPVTLVNMDMMHCAALQFKADLNSDNARTHTIAEITLPTLRVDTGEVDNRDFLDRADLLNYLGHSVMITNCNQYKNLIAYLHNYRLNKLGLVIGARPLLELISEKYLQNKDGMLLNAFSEICTKNVHLYVYPAQKEGSGEVMTSQNIPVAEGMRNLYQHILQQRHIVDIQGYNAETLHIYSPEVFRRIQTDEAGWEKALPAKVAQYIREHFIFGLPCKSINFEY